MENDFKIRGWSGITEMSSNDLIKSSVTVEMQVVDSSLKMHGKDQSHKS